MANPKIDDIESIYKEGDRLSKKIDDLATERNLLRKVDDFLSKDSVAQLRWIEDASRHLQGNAQELEELKSAFESSRIASDKRQAAYEELLKANDNAMKQAEEEYGDKKRVLNRAACESKGMKK